MLMFKFEFGTFRWFYYTILVSCRESCLLVSLCAGERCDMMSNDDDRGRNRRSGAEDWG
jgi:hypothetical protein